MKIVKKSKEKHIKLKKPITKPIKEQVLIVAQEIKFARLLSGNEKKTRDRVLKALKKWLTNCFQKNYDFKLGDFTRVWKGLFYAVWMSDKPLVQEELCESIAAILDLFAVEHTKQAMLMVKAGLRVLATEWYGIDQHRMDKFLMLVRRYLRGSFRVLKRSGWSEDNCELFASILSSTDGIMAVNTPLYARNATSMIMHFMDCFLEELSKVSEGKIPDKSVAILYRPFCRMLSLGSNPVLYTGARRSLMELLRQSDSGLEYMDRYRAWQKMGCPAGGPEALEPASEDEEGEDEQVNGDDQAGSGDDALDDDREKPLDPRAGRVHVALTPIPVPSKQLSQCLKDLLPQTSSKAHKRTTLCIQRFESLSKGEYPLRESETEMEPRGSLPQPSKVATQLLALDDQLIADSDELALRGLSRKHRKRLLAKSRAGLSIVDDVITTKQHTATASTEGDWLVEDTEPLKKKQKVLRENNKKEKIKQKKNKKHKGKIVEADAKHRTGKDAVDGKVKSNKEPQRSKDKVNKNKENKKKQVKVEKNNEKQPKKPISLVYNVGKSKKEKDTKKSPVLVVNNKAKNIQKSVPKKQVNKVEKPTSEIKKPTTPEKMQSVHTPKKVKFVLKNNSMQEPIEYYKSVRSSPNIPFDGSKKPTKTNLKPWTPSPINPFFKRKLRMRK